MTKNVLNQPEVVLVSPANAKQAKDTARWDSFKKKTTEKT